jgi:hypothetical protein
LTSLHDEIKVGIKAIGALRNLVGCSIGKVKAIESGGIEVLLAAVNNHLDSAFVCVDAWWARTYLVQGSSLVWAVVLLWPKSEMSG